MLRGRVILEKINSKKYALRSRLSFINDKYEVEVNPGLITDGASIPKILWSFVGSPFSGKYVEAAIIHDALYDSCTVSRKEADQIFYEIMISQNVNKIKAKIMYLGVRIGGRNHFNLPAYRLSEDTVKVSIK